MLQGIWPAFCASSVTIYQVVFFNRIIQHVSRRSNLPGRTFTAHSIFNLQLLGLCTQYQLVCVSLGQHPCWGGGCFYYLLGPWHDQLGLFRGQTPRENSVRKESLILCVKTKSRERRWRWRAHVTKLMCIPDFLKDRIFFPPAVYFVKKIKISSLCISWLSVHLGGPENTQTKYSGWSQEYYNIMETKKQKAQQIVNFTSIKFLWFQLAWPNLRSALSIQIINNKKCANTVIRLQKVWPIAHNYCEVNIPHLTT